MWSGKGQQFNEEDGQITYDGEWENNMRSGDGMNYYPDGKIYYTGEWENNMRSGDGILFDKNGNITYEGKWKNDRST